MKIDYIVANDNSGNYKTITEALAVAKDYQTIYVKSGIYKEGFVIDKKIKLIGDIKKKPEVINDCDNVCIVKENAVIENIIFGNISNNFSEETEVEQYSILSILASPLINNCEIKDSFSIGIEISNQSNVTIVNSKIYNNKFYNVYIDEDAAPVFNYCDIRAGESTGILICDESNCSLVNCSVHDNSCSNIEVGDLSRIYMEECSITDSEWNGLQISDSANGVIKNCYFAYNQGSNLTIEDYSTLAVLNCEIVDAIAFGIEIYTEGNVIIKDSKILDNVSGDISLPENLDSNIDIIDCKYNK